MCERHDAQGRTRLSGLRLREGIPDEESPDGSLILHPLVEMPAREAWLFKNPKALALVQRGLMESAEGKTVELGSFAQYADDEPEE